MNDITPATFSKKKGKVALHAEPRKGAAPRLESYALKWLMSPRPARRGRRNVAGLTRAALSMTTSLIATQYYSLVQKIVLFYELTRKLRIQEKKYKVQERMEERERESCMGKQEWHFLLDKF
jgi:hypothetical protein